MFALSWLITWFAHVINDPDSIFRIFDFFLATHPLMPIYFGAAVSRNHLSDVISTNFDAGLKYRPAKSKD
jgi:hypothetical protein